MEQEHFVVAYVFQSTLPAGEATVLPSDQRFADVISIHASREGSDITLKGEGESSEFQSTLPAGEATKHHMHTGSG